MDKTSAHSFIDRTRRGLFMRPLLILSAFKCEHLFCHTLNVQTKYSFSASSRDGFFFFLYYVPSAGIYCCGLLSTRKSDCTGLPQSMLINTEAPQQRGQSHIKMRGNMSIINWYNKGNFRFLTNAYSPTKEGKKSNKRKRANYKWHKLHHSTSQRAFSL